MKLKYYLRGLGMGILVTAMITGVSNKNATVMTEDQIRAEARKLGMVEGSTVLSESDNESEVEEGTEKEDNKQDEDTSNEEEEEQEPQETNETVSENSRVDESDEVNADKQDSDGIETVSDNAVTENADEIESDTSDDEESVVTEEPEDDKTKEADVEEEITEADETEEEQPETTEQAILTEATIEVHAGESSMIISTKLEAVGIIESAHDFDKYLCTHGYDKVLHTGKHTIRVGATYEEIAKKLMSRP